MPTLALQKIKEGFMLKARRGQITVACMSTVASLAFVFLLFAYAQVKPSGYSPWHGRKIFHAKGCSKCHSVYGEGGEGGPDLGRQKFYGTYLDLAALMWNHYPGMAKKMAKKGYEIDEFSNEEMAQLISYLAYIRYLGEPGNEHIGRKLLHEKSCIKCHKFGGEGGDIGPDISKIQEYLSPLMLAESMWNHGPKLEKKFEKLHLKWPEFHGHEFADLAVGIRSYMSPTRVSVDAFAVGDPVRGEQIAKEKGCFHCHAYKGAGGKKGPDFSDIDMSHSVTEIAGEMWNHGPQMWAVIKKEKLQLPVFQKGEMADVIAYLYGLKLEDAPGNPEHGKEIIQRKGCLNCHSIRGQGSDVAADFATLDDLNSLLQMITAMWNHAPAMQEKFAEKKLKWPEFSGRDMADIYAYLHSLKPQPGQAGNPKKQIQNPR